MEDGSNRVNPLVYLGLVSLFASRGYFKKCPEHVTFTILVKIKVKKCHYMPRQALRFPGG
jgi:hypothetical protein